MRSAGVTVVVAIFGVFSHYSMLMWFLKFG